MKYQTVEKWGYESVTASGACGFWNGNFMSFRNTKYSGTRTVRSQSNKASCVLSSGWFIDICSLNVNVSEHTACSFFVGGNVRTYLLAYENGTEYYETLAFNPSTPNDL
jgi:hypothetical protein